MGHAIFDFLRSVIAGYGYWAVAVALLSENAGIPVPGEAGLLLAFAAALFSTVARESGHVWTTVRI